jgi:hypothetical protein
MPGEDKDTRIDADGKRHYKMKPMTGFMGLHGFKKLPEHLADKTRRVVRYGLNKVGLGYLVPERKRGAKKGSKHKSSYHR